MCSLGVYSVGLVPPATGSRYMELADRHGFEVRLFRGRVPFINPETGKAAKQNRGDSCLLLFSPESAGLASATWSYVQLSKLRQGGEALLVAA